MFDLKYNRKILIKCCVNGLVPMHVLCSSFGWESHPGIADSAVCYLLLSKRTPIECAEILNTMQFLHFTRAQFVTRVCAILLTPHPHRFAIRISTHARNTVHSLDFRRKIHMFVQRVADSDINADLAITTIALPHSVYCTLNK